MKFCPECGAALVTQKFCHECGCNISTYLSGASEANSNNNFIGGFDTFDFSALQNAATEQLNEQNEKEKFYKNAEINGTALVKYKGSEENVVIPEGITRIKNSAFNNAKVKSIRVPASVTKIEMGSLWSKQIEQIDVDSDNKHYKSIDGVVYSKDGRTLVYFPSGRNGYYAMPNEVEFMEECAFLGAGITGVSLSCKLTQINRCAFSGTAIQSLLIPDSVLNIGVNAFQDCYALTSVTISGSVKAIEYGAFSLCKELKSVVVNEGVVSIGVGAFQQCSSLTSVSLPDSLSSLGEFAFLECKALTRITIPKCITVLKRSTFSGCRSLSEVTLQEGLTRIEEEAFRGCNLQSVKIPYSVQSIDEFAFPEGYIDIFRGIKYKMYVPSGRRYGLDSRSREFIDY